MRQCLWSKIRNLEIRSLEIRSFETVGITYECIKNVMNEVPTPCYIVSEALLEKI